MFFYYTVICVHVAFNFMYVILFYVSGLRPERPDKSCHNLVSVGEMLDRIIFFNIEVNILNNEVNFHQGLIAKRCCSSSQQSISQMCWSVLFFSSLFLREWIFLANVLVLLFNNSMDLLVLSSEKSREKEWLKI